MVSVVVPEQRARPASTVGGDDTGTSLRGAAVAVDPRRVARAAVALVVVSLAVLGALLLVAGVHRNAQVNRLREHGVVVAVKVSGCRGLLGGSGTNAAGYACSGTFSFAGRRYRVSIPGDTLLAPRSTIHLVADPGDPGLVSTPGSVADERASSRVFIVPAVLLLCAAMIAGIALVKRRSAGSLGVGRSHSAR